MKSFKAINGTGEWFMSFRDRLLKTRQVAKALNVSASTIKRWVDSGEIEAKRTVGKHRLIPLSEALKFVRRQGLSEAGLESLGNPDSPVANPGSLSVTRDDMLDELTDILQRGDAIQARALLRRALEGPGGAVFLADQLIRPAMERLGQRWMVGVIDVYHEHQASQLLSMILAELNDLGSRFSQRSAAVALGATPESDPYQLPLQLGDLVLRECGWNVRNLGVNLPLRSLAAAVGEYRPRLVFLSVSHLEDEEKFARDYIDFFESVASQDVAVVLGGRALGPDLRARLVYASFGERMAHLAEFARRLEPTRVGPSLLRLPREIDPTSVTLPRND